MEQANSDRKHFSFHFLHASTIQCLEEFTRNCHIFTWVTVNSPKEDSLQTISPPRFNLSRYWNNLKELLVASPKELTKTILWRKDFCNYYFIWCIFPTAEHQQTILFLLQTTLTFGLVDVNMLVNQTIILKANHQIQKEVNFFHETTICHRLKRKSQNRLYNLQEWVQDRVHLSLASHPSETCPRCPEH